jgi:hypothetical protein
LSEPADHGVEKSRSEFDEAGGIFIASAVIKWVDYGLSMGAHHPHGFKPMFRHFDLADPIPIEVQGVCGKRCTRHAVNMFLRHEGADEPPQAKASSGFAKVGVGLLIVGGLLDGLGAFGDHLVGRVAFAAILLPIAGVAFLVIAWVSYTRGLKAASRPPKEAGNDSNSSNSV